MTGSLPASVLPIAGSSYKCQTARGDRIEIAHPHQPLADRAEVGRPAVDECLERGPSHLEWADVIERQTLDFGRAHGRRRTARSGRGPMPATSGSVDVTELLIEPIPGGRLCRLVPAGQGIAQARDHLAPGTRLGGSRRLRAER